jgi:Tol biopolymer transport system component
MSDTKELLERARARFTPPEGVMESLIRRRTRRGRNRRIAAAVVAMIVALVSFAALIRTFQTVERPAKQPTPAPTPTSIFADVGGWIAYGENDGIWAVNPTGQGAPEDQVQLTDRGGEPLAWSSDGSKLLINRGDPSYLGPDDLVVLNSDGTETLLVHGGTYDGFSGGSFTPDGSKVIYGVTNWPPDQEWRSGIYVVDADGGSPRVILAAGQRNFADGTFRTALFGPTLSPDGTQIAYFDGMGDWGNSLRVMNADGSGVRVLIDQEFGHVDDLGWSPDGSRLAFDEKYGGGVWIVGVDGSGLTEVVPSEGAPRWSPTGSRLAFQSAGGIWVINADGSGRREVAAVGRDPVWSPDGSRIAYLDAAEQLVLLKGERLRDVERENSLYVADLDGTHVRKLGTLELTPSSKPRLVWIPLPLSASGEEQPTATAGGVPPFIYALVALGVVGVFVLAWRGRRRTAAR